MIYFELFYVFFLIGLFTFGGGYSMIPLIEDETISRGWITEETFREVVTISESTPGPVAINMATFVGNQTAGIIGSFFATLGVILPSFLIILLIASVFTKLLDKPIIKAILKGFQAVVIGLIFATAIYFIAQDFTLGDIRDGNTLFLWQSLIIFVGVFLLVLIYRLIRKKNLSPYLILLLGGILGVVVYSIFPL